MTDSNTADICDLESDLLACTAITPAELSSIPFDVVTRYSEDAARLSVRRIRDRVNVGVLDPSMEPASIPAHLADLYLQALLHVYMADDIPERDTVITMLGIRSSGRPGLSTIVVELTSESSWHQVWSRRGSRLTGSRTIDSILVAIDLWPRKVSGIELYFLDSAAFWNLRPVAQGIHDLEDVVVAKVEESAGSCNFGDQRDITALLTDSKVELTYTFAWGDCFNGCIFRRDWNFVVERDGHVRHESTRGDTLGAR